MFHSLLACGLILVNCFLIREHQIWVFLSFAQLLNIALCFILLHVCDKVFEMLFNFHFKYSTLKIMNWLFYINFKAMSSSLNYWAITFKLMYHFKCYSLPVCMSLIWIYSIIYAFIICYYCLKWILVDKGKCLFIIYNNPCRDFETFDFTTSVVVF